MVEALSAKDYETFQTWSSNEVKPSFSFKGHTNSVESVAFSPKGLELVSGSHDHSIRRWDLNTMKCSDVFVQHSEGVTKLKLGEYLLYSLVELHIFLEKLICTI